MTSPSPPRDGAWDTAKFPRTAAYIADLPGGFDAHPTFRSKGSIFRQLLDELGVPLRTDGLPLTLAALIRTPPSGNTWVPTVHINALELVIADTLGTDTAFLQLAYQMNRKLLGSAMYRPLVFVSSPAFLLKVSAMVWGRFHLGTVLRPQIEPRSARLFLTFPPRLHPRLVLDEKATAYRAALEAAGARDVTVVVDDATTDGARFALTWA